MTQFLNFEKSELVAANYEEAVKMAPFFINRNVTQSFKNWKAKQTGVVTEAMIKDWCLSFLASESKNAPGVGFMVVLDTAITNKRTKPFTKVNIKNEGGKREWDTNLHIIGKTSGTVYAKVTLADVKAKAEDPEKIKRVRKSDANEVIKDLYGKKGVTENILLKYVKETRDPEQAIAAEYVYTPTAHTKPGTYMAFGVKA